MKLTREEILNMPAGEEMNTHIAEDVMGERKPIYSHTHASALVLLWSQGGQWYCLPTYETGDVCKWKPRNFSGDIAMAWEVVDALKKWGRNLRLVEYAYNRTYATFDNSSIDPGALEWAEANGENAAPLAISRAALLLRWRTNARKRSE